MDTELERLADLDDRLAALAALWGRSRLHTLTVVLTRGLRDAESMAVCRDCACTDFDPCERDDGQPCSWAGEDLCTACALRKGGSNHDGQGGLR